MLNCLNVPVPYLLLFLGILFQPLPVAFGLLHHFFVCDT